MKSFLSFEISYNTNKKETCFQMTQRPFHMSEFDCDAMVLLLPNKCRIWGLEPEPNFYEVQVAIMEDNTATCVEPIAGPVQAHLSPALALQRHDQQIKKS